MRNTAFGCVVVGGIFAVWVSRQHVADPEAFLDAYCTACHNETDWDGGVAFDTAGPRPAALAFDGAHEAEVWETAIRKVRAGLMPPAGADRPERAALDSFASTLESRMDEQHRANPYAGAEPLSRLNRAEYANAVRDLLAFDVGEILDMLPADASVGGFDNIGDGLTVSPTLIEAYVAAAITIGRQAVGDRAMNVTQVKYDAPARLAQNRHIDGLPLGTRGGFLVTHNFPLDAVYEIRIAALGRGPLATQAFCEPPAVTVVLNGAPLDAADPTMFRIHVPAGPQTIGAALIDRVRCAGVNELYDSYSIAGGIRSVEIHGPFDATGPGDTPSREAIFGCYPQSAGEEEPCARSILSRLATRAYRRPLSEADPDVDVLVEFFRAGREQGDFETGIQQAVSRMLMSPQFVFQLEHEPEHMAPGSVYRISGPELATRLSFFLWSSIPDLALIELADEGLLGDPAVFEQQVRRLLRDARAQALVDNFAGQWLGLRELEEALPQDAEFDANLRSALALETKLLFSSMIDEDRSVLDLLDADHTFLNERLARHYGIAEVHGSYMRRVQLDADSPRRGLIGKGSWLTATSVADRTSPVIRGQWFLTRLLGAPVPEPPAGVEADLSDEAAVAREGDTLRARLERHRANPTCASCHQIMDPIGLALENFDLVGRWRVVDNGKPVDASAELIDGTQLTGPRDLRRELLSRSDQFATAFVEQLLSYALGRVVDYRDMPAVRRIVRDAASENYRFSAIVLGIARSDAFQKRVKTGASTAEEAL